MHGFQGYQPNLNSHIERINILKKYFSNDAEVGYSDHIDAENKFSIFLPLFIP